MRPPKFAIHASAHSPSDTHTQMPPATDNRNTRRAYSENVRNPTFSPEMARGRHDRRVRTPREIRKRYLQAAFFQRGQESATRNPWLQWQRCDSENHERGVKEWHAREVDPLSTIRTAFANSPAGTVQERARPTPTSGLRASLRSLDVLAQSPGELEHAAAAEHLGTHGNLQGIASCKKDASKHHQPFPKNTQLAMTTNFQIATYDR